MKNTYFFACVFAAVLLICIAILQLPSPLSEFDQGDVVWWLTWDRDIHHSYLSLPESQETGSYTSHKFWIDSFNEIIARAKKMPSKLTKDECIQLLYLAQSTHAGNTATDYSTVNWHSRWYEAYGKIIVYMKSQ